MQVVDIKLTIDERIKVFVHEIKNPILQKAAFYSLFPGGKRLRPKMLLSIAGDIGLDAACAIELIHTYTLIHDDLPAMDDDDFRRGKPSLHKAFDEATAILTGDLLLTLAFEVIAKSPLPSPLSLELIRLISNYIGGNGLIQGQILDLTSKNPLWEEYQHIALKKTADLFTVALIVGARIKNLPETDIALYTQFGQTFGLLYQIKDDLEDGNSPLPKASLTEMTNLLTLNAKHLLSNISIPNTFLYEYLSF